MRFAYGTKRTNSMVRAEVSFDPIQTCALVVLTRATYDDSHTRHQVPRSINDDVDTYRNDCAGKGAGQGPFVAAQKRVRFCADHAAGKAASYDEKRETPVLSENYIRT